MPWCQRPPGPGSFEDYAWSLLLGAGFLVVQRPHILGLGSFACGQTCCFSHCSLALPPASLGFLLSFHPFCYSVDLPLGCPFSTGSGCQASSLVGSIVRVCGGFSFCYLSYLQLIVHDMSSVMRVPDLSTTISPTQSTAFIPEWKLSIHRMNAYMM